MQQVTLGLVGGGTVGGGVVAALNRNGALLASRLGLTLRVARIAVQDPKKNRSTRLPPELVTADWQEVVNDPTIQVVAELMGGTTTAREVVRTALSLGKPVVTANKALLSAHGEELFAIAARHGANLYYEASVAGGIPIIKILRESLVGNRVTRLAGIVNGTCNYILTRMKLEGAEFGDVLADAQRLGYAEAEPSLDVDGHDAAHKTGILASLAHGFWVAPEQVYTEGIRQISPLDIQFAAQLGYTIKLLGIVKMVGANSGDSRGRRKNPSIQVSVYPALIPNSHVLASVNYAFNAISVRGDIVGDTLFYGRGAGAEPTASAVLSDLADAALDLCHGSPRRVPPFVCHEGNGCVLGLDEVVSRYYVRLSVMDRPGVFSRIANVLAKARIGISSIIQPEGHAGETVPVILMIHDAPNAAMKRALAQIARLSVVKDTPVMIRVESLE
ncbi:MAG TPA: homoserine dehydrogenase [Verrucomicrobiota bacterium]|nr:homoserine dehydrogenase [Verrucomicrobiales bacterium]HRI13601.1 homoserine dehydrogenase [Verrucomicrobiota bacterium]